VVRLKVDVITGGNAALAAKQASSVVPIVFRSYDRSVSLARFSTGGNITGCRRREPKLPASTRACVKSSRLRRLATCLTWDIPPACEVGEVQSGRRLGLDLSRWKFGVQRTLRPPSVVKDRADALYVIGDALVFTHGCDNPRFDPHCATADDLLCAGVRQGGLMSYGPNVPDLFRRAANMVDKILRGARPGELPIEQPTKFDLVINLTTAKGLGLTIPESFLLLADEVIE
jgi:putative ABC transport system substrate-binding protein